MDATSLAQAILFEYLIHNTDVHGANFHVDADGRVRVFDHDHAFRLGLPERRIFLTQDEGFLPPVFPGVFLDRLACLDQRVLTENLWKFLSPAQINALLFRRDVLLTLARRREETTGSCAP